MKKILAMTLSLIMCGAMFVSCGDTDSSSKADKDSSSSSAAESSSSAADAQSKADDAENSSEESSTADESSAADTEDASSGEVNAAENNEGALGKAFTEKINTGVYDIEGVMTSEFTGETPVVMTYNNNDFHVIVSMLGTNIEMYGVDGKIYQVVPAAQMYSIMDDDDAAQLNISSYGLDENYKFKGTSEKDGYTVESYDVFAKVEAAEGVTVEQSDEPDGSADYYFDSDGELKKIVTSLPLMGDTTIEFTKVSFDDVKIELPDMSSWQEFKQGDELSDADKIRMQLGVFGITKEMVEKAGSTYEDFAKLDEDAQRELVKKIAADNGISIATLGLDDSEE